MGLILFLILIHVLVNIFYNLPTLHERMNEQQVVSTDKQTWARIYGNTESNNGDSRFNYNQHVRAAQVGQDLYNKTTGSVPFV